MYTCTRTYVPVRTQVHKKGPPKYNGIVFRILGKHQWNLASEFSTYLYIVSKNTWKFNVKIMFYYMFSITRQKHKFLRQHGLRSQLFPMKQCDHSLVVIKSVQNVLCPPSQARHWVTAALMISWLYLDHSSTSRSTMWSTLRASGNGKLLKPIYQMSVFQWW